MDPIRVLRSRVVRAVSVALLTLLALAAPVLADGGSVIYPHIIRL